MKTILNTILFTVMVGLIATAAIPNYLDARVRERLARAHSDLPVLAAALEAYNADRGLFPYDGYNDPTGQYNYWYFNFQMTTPVAYLSELRVDPFREDLTNVPDYWHQYRYVSTGSTWGTDYFKPSPSVYYDEVTTYWGGYRVVSVGPDGIYGPASGWYSSIIAYPGFSTPYDPTNGLISSGDIDRGQKYPVYLE